MFCPKCGKEIKDNNKFCPNCGTVVNQQVPESISEQKKSKKRHKVIWILAGIILIVVICAMIFGNSDSESDNSSPAEDKASTTANEQVINAKSSDEHTIDISQYWNTNEDELLTEFGYEKNEMGMYPTDENINFMYAEDGSMFMLSIRDGHDTSNQFSIYGIQIGDNYNITQEKIPTEYKLLGHKDSGENGYTDVYGDELTLKELLLEYNADNKIVSVNLCAGLKEDFQQTDEIISEQDDDSLEDDRYYIDDSMVSDLIYGFYMRNDSEYICYIDYNGESDVAVFSLESGTEDIFYGSLTQTEFGGFYAYDETSDTEMMLTFYDKGDGYEMNVAVISATDETMYNLEGLYDCVRVYDFSNAG